MDTDAAQGIMIAIVLGSVVVTLVVVYIVFFVRPRIRNAQNSAASHGAIRCPYCGSVTARDVRILVKWSPVPSATARFAPAKSRGHSVGRGDLRRA